MLLKLKEKEEYYWTRHSREKMRQYQLSESRVKRVFKRPDRKELGIAPRTIAIMQISGTKKHPQEIWVMYQKVKSKNKKEKITKVISVWKYPGRSPEGKAPPIPEDILWELKLKDES